MPEFMLSIQSFAMCSPATGSIPSFDAAGNMSWDDEADFEIWRLDDGFLPKRQFRRISRLSKIAMYTAHHALLGVEKNVRIGASIFCSRFGEYQNTANVLDALHSDELVSPMDFSYAVHNTAQGLFSILSKDEKPATALCAREGVVEQAIVKAYAQLCGGDDAVLVVYHEDVLPDVYSEFLQSHLMPLSFAMVLSKKRGDMLRNFSLSYKDASKGVDERREKYCDNRHEQDLARMLFSGQGDVSVCFNRLEWKWKCGEY